MAKQIRKGRDYRTSKSRDGKRSAKPFGYRFVGDSRRRPTKKEIEKHHELVRKGKDSKIYFENRVERSDTNPFAKRGLRYSDGGIVKSDINWKDEVKSNINNEGFDNAFTTYSTYEEIKNRRFHLMRKAYLTALNKLKKYIPKLKEGDRDIVQAYIDKEGFDYGVGGYSDFKDEICDKKFLALQKEYVKSRNKLAKFVGVNEKYADGGGIEIEEEYNPENDLFNKMETLPDNVREVLDRYSEEDPTYESLGAMLKELEPLGYTFEYYLDAEPFNLRKITHAKGGGVGNSKPEHYRYLTIQKVNGGLKISLNEEGIEEVKDLKEDDKSDLDIWSELFEDVQGNSEYRFHSDMGESGFGLTSAEGITDGYFMSDDGSEYETNYPESAKVYWFPNYMITSSLDRMFKEGSVVFTEAMANGGGVGSDSEWEGTDSDLEISLEEYGFVAKHTTKDYPDEYWVIYKIGDDAYGSGYVRISDLNAIINGESFADADDVDSFLNTTGMTKEEWLDLSFVNKLLDLFNYWGYQNIMGTDYSPNNKEWAYSKIGIEDTNEYARGGFVSKGEMVWNKLTSSKRAEFLHQNFTPEITPRGQEILVGKAYNFLPKNVKTKIEAKYANVEDYAKGGVVNGRYLDTISDDKKSKILKNIANHYGVSVSDAEAEVKDADAEMLYEYIANDQSLRMDVYNDFKRNKYAKGGGVGNENAQMVLNNVKQIEHHAKELYNVLKGIKNVPAWVVAKVNRSASDLSDATHYLDGENDTMAKGGGVGEKVTIKTVDWANDDNKQLGTWLLTSVDGNKILSSSKNGTELEKNVMAYYKKKGSVAKMTWDDDADDGLSWVTFTDLFNEINSIGKTKMAKGGEIIKTKFNSHEDHNPEYDILEGHLDEDSYITYAIKVKGDNIGKESMEYYVGENYKVGSKKKSFSRHYEPNKIPEKYKLLWLKLKEIYETKKYENGGGIGSQEKEVREILESKGEISCYELGKIIGHSPCYPVCKVGDLTMRKKYLRGYREI